MQREREMHIFPYHRFISPFFLFFHVFLSLHPLPLPCASRFCSPRKRLRNSRTERGEAMMCSAISAACTTWAGAAHPTVGEKSMKSG